MEQSNNAPAYRLPFFDNVRSLMVVLVLIFHAGASYSSAVDFWPFHEASTSLPIDLFLLLGDVFMMAILFFIAGYFALPSWQKRGGRDFIIEKIKHLGIPWLFVTTLILPVLDYLHYIIQSSEYGHPVRSYGVHWLLSMKKIVEFHFGWMDMSGYWNMTEHFYQRYMWFISLLLLFLVVFAGLLEIVKKTGHKTERSTEDGTLSQKSVFHALIITGLLTILLFTLIRFLFYPKFMGNGWFSLGNLIQFQCGKVVIYACYFGIGSYAYHRRWFTGRVDFGPIWPWGLSCFLLFGANMFVMMKLNQADTQPLTLRLAFTTFYPLWTLSFLGIFIAFSVRYWNRVTPLNREVAANSYTMYLVHYIFPMTVPLLLSTWKGGPVLIKFMIVALVTVAASYAVSRYIVRPFPFGVVIGLFGASLILAAIT